MCIFLDNQLFRKCADPFKYEKKAQTDIVQKPIQLFRKCADPFKYEKKAQTDIVQKSVQNKCYIQLLT